MSFSCELPSENSADMIGYGPGRRAPKYKWELRITADMKSRMRVGEKGQVVIPKELRELTGIKEGTEVTVGLKDGALTIRRASPPTESYVEYFTSTFSKKLHREVNIKRLLEEERVERHKRIS